MCFNALWFAHLVVMLILIVGCVMIVRIVIPWLISKLGGDGGIFAAVFNVIVWMAVCIMAVWLLYDLFTCLIGSVRVW